MAVQQKKPSGEPTAGAQAKRNYSQSYSQYDNDIIAEANRLTNEERDSWTTMRLGKKIKNEYYRPAETIEQQIAKNRSFGDAYNQDYYHYKADVLEKYLKSRVQDATEAGVKEKRKSIQQPRRTNLTGAQGIVGSAMNLGSSGLLGG